MHTALTLLITDALSETTDSEYVDMTALRDACQLPPVTLALYKILHECRPSPYPTQYTKICRGRGKKGAKLWMGSMVVEKYEEGGFREVLDWMGEVCKWKLILEESIQRIANRDDGRDMDSQWGIRIEDFDDPPLACDAEIPPTPDPMTMDEDDKPGLTDEPRQTQSLDRTASMSLDSELEPGGNLLQGTSAGGEEIAIAKRDSAPNAIQKNTLNQDVQGNSTSSSSRGVISSGENAPTSNDSGAGDESASEPTSKSQPSLVWKTVEEYRVESTKNVVTSFGSWMFAIRCLRSTEAATIRRFCISLPDEQRSSESSFKLDLRRCWRFSDYLIKATFSFNYEDYACKTKI
ncbi:hypothetical protein SISNIDRAFT_494388 [Sistotremastrum niveocremeum HHB9708]|uniref:Uncharacterized protein n=1 Tax=Sistotremastrum niveocremeum HHB9708 TaxID=1314777 RepID=A0A164WYX0_9AGAM|nr:hypothetical protein SISNIDRAFT_494388 [Sistotremastrum niveocremeum HHB9708]